MTEKANGPAVARPPTRCVDVAGLHPGAADGSSWVFERLAPEHRLPDCEQPKLFRCEVTGAVELRRCDATRVQVCEPCAVRYRRRVRRVAYSGAMLPGRVFMVTLTAPGSERHRVGRSPQGPWCPCTPAGGVDLARWNGEAAARWNRLQWDIKRVCGVEFEYFRAVEAQERGALHFHVLVRVTAGAMVPLAKLRRLAIRHGFGHEVDVQELADENGRERAAGYCAKYVSKASGDREAVPFVHRATGEVGAGRWRTWTCSRRWGSSMKAIRRAQFEWWLQQQADGRSGSDAGRRAPEAPLDPSTTDYASGGSVTPAAAVRLPM